jgi:hypothetical protein
MTNRASSWRTLAIAHQSRAIAIFLVFVLLVCLRASNGLS